jgi:hypothetical protein
MTAKRLHEVYFRPETIVGDQTLGLPGEWPARLPDGVVEVLEHVAALQLFVKIKNAGATPPGTPTADFRLQFNLAEDDADEVAADWADLLALNTQTTVGLKKSTVLTDPLPRRVRLARSASATAWNNGWTIEAWLVLATRIGR